MGLSKIACRVTPEQTGRRLDQFLAQAFPVPFSRRRIRRLIDAGAVYVDGKRVRVASRKLRPAASVEVWLEEAPPTAASDLGPPHVLYEDSDLIAVDKPPGMAVQATVADAVHDLFAQLRRFLAERDRSTPYLALHHRLDRGTSGVVVFAKERRANRRLAEAFAGQQVRKVYHALCAPAAPEPPRRAWTVRNRLSALRNAGGGPRRVVAVAAGGRPAETELRPVRRFPGAVWVEALPKTGRTHQIRVHLADSGLPVLGDARYGAGARIPAPRLMLHALAVTLAHPVTGEVLSIESPLPEDFRDLVRALERGCR